MKNSENLDRYDLANLFKVNPDAAGKLLYNLNKTVYIWQNDAGLDDPSKYESYEVGASETWQLISHKKYGTYKLWWIICKMNGVHDPVSTMPEPGMVLKLPKYSFVQEVLSAIYAEGR